MAERAEPQIRKEAIHRFLQGENPKRIYRELKCNKRWFFKWFKRYQSGEPRWFKDYPKAPHRQSNRISHELERQIVEIRVRLQNTKYWQLGANAIDWNLKKEGLPPVPVSTINRVIRRHDLSKKKRKYQPRKATYPPWPCLAPNSLHQADPVNYLS